MAGRVIDRDEVVLHVLGERATPDMRPSSGVVVDAAHTGVGCVRASEDGGAFWHDFPEVRGALAEIRGEPSEVAEMIMEVARDADTGALRPVQG